jgi:hypothetical protein
MKKSIFVLLIAIGVITTAHLEVLYADDEVAVGQPCTDTDRSWRWTTSVRTKWEIGDICAVPVGLSTPTEWESSVVFHDRIHSALDTNPSVQNYVQAMTSVWHDFFSGNADVLVLLQRTVDSDIRNLECTSGTWAIASEESSSKLDDSGWVRVISSFDVNELNATVAISTSLQQILDDMNTQPGADTRQIESLVVQQ